jgi:hypothetical protein
MELESHFRVRLTNEPGEKWKVSCNGTGEVVTSLAQTDYWNPSNFHSKKFSGDSVVDLDSNHGPIYINLQPEE